MVFSLCGFVWTVSHTKHSQNALLLIFFSGGLRCRVLCPGVDARVLELTIHEHIVKLTTWNRLMRPVVSRATRAQIMVKTHARARERAQRANDRRPAHSTLLAGSTIYHYNKVTIHSRALVDNLVATETHHPAPQTNTRQHSHCSRSRARACQARITIVRHDDRGLRSRIDRFDSCFGDLRCDGIDKMCVGVFWLCVGCCCWMLTKVTRCALDRRRRTFGHYNTAR